MTNTYKREHVFGKELVKRSTETLAVYATVKESLQADIESFAIQLAEGYEKTKKGDIRPIYTFFETRDENGNQILDKSDITAMTRWLMKFAPVRMATEKELAKMKRQGKKIALKYKIVYNAKGNLNILDGEKDENRWDKFKPQQFNGLQQLAALKQLHKKSLEAADVNYAELKREGVEVKRKAVVNDALTAELEKLIKRFETKSNVA